MKLKGILLDFDGLTTDSEIVYAIILAKIINEAGGKVTVEQVALGTAGFPFTDALAEAERLFNVTLPENALETWHRLADEYFLTELKPCLGVEEFLASNTLPFAIASGSSVPLLKQKLKAAGLAKYVPDEYLFSGEDVANPKPAPDVYIAAAKGIDLDPKDCIALEDSVRGAKAAIASGAYTVGCIAGSHIIDKQDARKDLLDAGVDEVINDMTELQAIIDRLS